MLLRLAPAETTKTAPVAINISTTASMRRSSEPYFVIFKSVIADYVGRKRCWPAKIVVASELIFFFVYEKNLEIYWKYRNIVV